MTNDTRLELHGTGLRTRFLPLVLGALSLCGVSFLTGASASALCADDAVAVGRLCVDKYQASVWSKPPGGADRGIQYGLADHDFPCADNGQDCDGIYAASIAGTLASWTATWFQAQQACANVGKRLLTNAEWQMAVQGTPDAGPDDGVSDCNTSGSDRVGAGTRSRCHSIYGVYDMVGDLSEWVADWVPKSATTCEGWGSASDDEMCLSGVNAASPGPGALIRGGHAESLQTAGPLAVNATVSPADVFGIGFRCVR